MGTTDIKPGDCFFNVRKNCCLRVKRVYQVVRSNGTLDWYADAMTWRPDGSKLNNYVKVKLDSLTKTPYWRMVATRVYTEHSSFEFELTAVQ